MKVTSQMTGIAIRSRRPAARDAVEAVTVRQNLAYSGMVSALAGEPPTGEAWVGGLDEALDTGGGLLAKLPCPPPTLARRPVRTRWRPEDR